MLLFFMLNIYARWNSQKLAKQLQPIAKIHPHSYPQPL